MRQKANWMHPRSRQWHLLDYVLVWKGDQQNVLVTKAIPSAVGWMDHRFPCFGPTATTSGITSFTSTIEGTTSECLTPATFAITTTTTTSSASDGDSALTYPHCDCKFTSHIGLVGHL
ncbi:unnamed protein product [Schistocephalus solidus]|uniref:C2H2-type domain-containing protein n=1 Tax=Schistocephalus solidus TaxID=70667 RepID=A0A183S934_SCHSO|nr:unnamed protein product [Schistocephalus solidus]